MITANLESGDYNGVALRVHDDGNSVGNAPVLAYDSADKVLDIEIENGVTRAADVIAELANTPAVADLFTITDAPGSTGTGTLTDGDPAWQSVSLSGGQPETITGDDVHPRETGGLFTALLRLQQALEAHDLLGVERAVGLLDARMLATDLARAELGVRQQSLDVLQRRLDSEDVELRATLSREYDADLAEVVSELRARQIALQAGLMSSAETLQMTIFNYL